jgi:hypothetical protein
MFAALKKKSEVGRSCIIRPPTSDLVKAGVAKLADATDLGSVAARRVGSIPIARTNDKRFTLVNLLSL